MRPKKFLAATAALSLLVSGSAAVAQSAQSLSLAGDFAQRAGAPVAESSDLGGRRGILGWVLGLVALGLVVFVVTEAAKDNDLPASP